MHQAKPHPTPLVYVAMSGGVDSSVAAALLKERGFRVVGVYMKPWQPRGVACLWQEERADALRVADALGIPLKTWDVSRAYRAKVALPMVHGYRSGRTPNPDVECNRHIKFGVFYERARREGADYVATGHYARIAKRTGGPALLKAVDANKDQTYFLWGIRRAQLAHILFPIGGMTKPEVRAYARAAGLPTAEKKDSQGVCFVGPLNMKSFLASVIRPRSGVIRHRDGRVLGTHDGAAYYTIGQRHGLDIRVGGGPYYVLRTDIQKNVVIVGTDGDLDGRTARFVRPNWLGPKPALGARVTAKIRYRTTEVPVVVTKGKLVFARAVRALTPGQSVVFFRGSRVLGGGILAAAAR
ncbi:MAG: tRNA 2-thiouridine(34) synthase MnmA [Candidatus Yanofskybacteria bacterium]|nr:tRNA 2-thiouridine(34) synthase MnmA [Candidatus Yanofskybacteria bacterium]